jgi:polysaccharide deacetylase family protein (PEP-CTERM system associated)
LNKRSAQPNYYKVMPTSLESTPPPMNALTVDVEDYYQVEAFTDVVHREDWPTWESRVVRNTQILLEMFARHQVHSTFFILGYVAEKHPDLVREIAAAGHEVACHSYYHRLVYTQTPEEFRQDLRSAKQQLEDLIGSAVLGYRAPSYSITAQSIWALDILIEEGFVYDSSIFPVHHDRYGMPEAERFPHLLHRPAGEIIEFPPSTVRVGGMNWPISGGGYFRLYPYSLFRQGWRRINKREAEVAIFFLHPWEIDPAQPIVPGTRLNIWRHRVNLKRTQAKLERLLKDFSFAPVRQVLAQKNLGLQSQAWALATN